MIPCRPRLSWGTQLKFLSLLAVLAALLVQVTAALAHPMGNFSINLYSRLDVGPTAIAITYVVDLAEIPTYQEFGGARPGARVQQEYLRRTATTLRSRLRLLVDGRLQEPRLTGQTISFPPRARRPGSDPHPVEVDRTAGHAISRPPPRHLL